MNPYTSFEHPYEMIPLHVAGYILGSVLLLGHLFALVKDSKRRRSCWLLRATICSPRFCWRWACSGSSCWWLPRDWES